MVWSLCHNRRRKILFLSLTFDFTLGYVLFLETTYILVWYVYPPRIIKQKCLLNYLHHPAAIVRAIILSSSIDHHHQSYYSPANLAVPMLSSISISIHPIKTSQTPWYLTPNISSLKRGSLSIQWQTSQVWFYLRSVELRTNLEYSSGMCFSINL